MLAENLNYRIIQLRWVALHLTVVPAPSFTQAPDCMCWTPTLRGWRPTRWWHVIRQQFTHTPAMIRDPGSHRWGGRATGLRQTRMRRTKIVDRADQIHAMLQ